MFKIRINGVKDFHIMLIIEITMAAITIIMIHTIKEFAIINMNREERADGP